MRTTIGAAAILIFAVAALAAEDTKPRPASTANESKASTPVAAPAQPAAPSVQPPPSTAQPPAPPPYTLSCEHPKNAEESDVCAQWQMAAAARESVEVARAQTDLIRIEAFGLLFTLLFTAIAAVAAHTSAKAAARSAKVAEDALRITERAHLGVVEFKIGGLADGDQPRNLVFRITNKGRTPATMTSHAVCAVATAVLPDVPDYSKGAVSTREQPIVPDQRIRISINPAPLSADKLALVFNQQETYWVWGYVEYRDAFNATHATRFCFSYDRNSGEMVVDGPSAYNTAT